MTLVVQARAFRRIVSARPALAFSSVISVRWVSVVSHPPVIRFNTANSKQSIYRKLMQNSQSVTTDDVEESTTPTDTIATNGNGGDA